jgi:hypothetical protein
VAKRINVEGKNYTVFKLDTGAQVNILPLNIFKQLKNINRNQTYCNININAYGGGKIKTLFKTKLKVFCNMSSREIEFIVADVKGQPLLGLAECFKLNLLQKIDSVVKDDNKSKCDFLKEYAHNFNGVGAYPEKYTVRLEQGTGYNSTSQALSTITYD